MVIFFAINFLYKSIFACCARIIGIDVNKGSWTAGFYMYPYFPEFPEYIGLIEGATSTSK